MPYLRDKIKFLEKSANEIQDRIFQKMSAEERVAYLIAVNFTSIVEL